jgi:hypothetical protein
MNGADDDARTTKSKPERFKDRVKAIFVPGPKPRALIKQMLAEQDHWNDLFSTKLIEAIERVAALNEEGRQLRLEFTERIVELESLVKRARVELTEKVAALESERTNPRYTQWWLWACSLAALLLGLGALVISLRGIR